jgi:hypothetical protein
MKRDKPPSPVVVKSKVGIVPVAAYDFELLDGLPVGTEFDLVERSNRSQPHHRLYWQVLNHVVKATGKWASAAYLHEELKIACGYTTKAVNWNSGQVLIIPASIAFDKMTQREFNEYFDAAMKMLSEHLGYDPLAST